MRRTNSRAFKLQLWACALAAGLAGPVHAQQVGTASAVNPEAQAGSRVLHIGSSIVFRERVSTTSAGSVHIIFIDKTTLSVGPNSNLVIDEFVYNPNSGKGRMTVSLAQGAVRVVGGNVSHTEGATVKTPVATIGIRGGTTTIMHDKNTRAINHFGTATLTRGGRTVTIKRPEFAATVSGLQTAQHAVERVSSSEVGAVGRRLTSRSDQTGGQRTTPSALKSAARAAASGETNARVPPPTFLPSVQGQTTSQDFGTHTFFRACCSW